MMALSTLSPRLQPALAGDAGLYRQVMGTFATGVTIITACGPDGAVTGVTASSFNTVSLDPPLVLWSLDLRALSLPLFRAASHFAVNILAEEQGELALRFARAGADKFAGLPQIAGREGRAPLIEGALAHLDCRVAARLPGGDHEILLGEVEAMGARPGSPLIFHASRFHRAAAL